MIENDYRIFHRFAGRSTLRTYLIMVIHRLLLDYRNRQWGKWHVSARAKCLGGTAVRLETLIHRDGCSPDEAIGKLLAGAEGAQSREELASIASALPHRVRRHFEGEERLREIVAFEQADARVLEAERAAAVRRLEAALDCALGTLASEDRLILKMRFGDGVTVRQIAATLHLESRILYRRIERCLKKIRSAMEAQSVTREAIRTVLGSRPPR